VSQLPAVSLTGPRASGETTTAKRCAARIVDLGRAAEAGLFRSDPDAALRGAPEPLLLDEWQEVPGVLGAVKRAVDADPRPGLAGSAWRCAAAFPTRSWTAPRRSCLATIPA
jgi:predicted AAA+ superfamily ATPase